jgi:RNA polymerase sigma-70 factor (ECF subfamily)
VDAFHRYDVDALTALRQDDAVRRAPSTWLQGPRRLPAGCAARPPAEPLPTAASGLPAFAQYRQGGRQAWGLVVLEPGPRGIAGWNTFLDVETLFPRFGLPMTFVD